MLARIAASVLAFACAAVGPRGVAFGADEPPAAPDKSLKSKPEAGETPPPATVPSAAEPVECAGATDLGRIIYTLDHPTGSPPPAPVTLKDGERFTVKVARTLPKLFVYKLYRQRTAPAQKSLEEAETTDVCLTEVHDKQFGGYTLVILPARSPVANYPPAVVVNIPVQTPQWQYGFAGAFVGSRLTDHVYYASKERQADGTEASIVRELVSGDRDWAKLGTAAFIHTTPPNWPMAVSFGLGISDGNKPTYYAGPSLRLGDQAFLTGGLAVGAVNRLPAGLNIGDRLTDANALSTLRARNTPAAFFALSYAFLNGRKALEKPFAPTDTTAAPAKEDTKPKPASDGKH